MLLVQAVRAQHPVLGLDLALMLPWRQRSLVTWQASLRF